MEVNKILKQWEQDKAIRATTESTWQEIADYCFPRRDFTTSRTPGQNRRTKIYDSTGTKSVIMLAAALHSNLTPIQTKWLYIRGSERNRDYWDRVTGELLDTFASPDSRFALQAHELYLDLAAFGTAVMGVFQRDGKIIFKTLNLADCWIRENQDGIVDTIKYCQKYTAEQMMAEFGQDNVSKEVRKCYEDGKNDLMFEVLHCVGPRLINGGYGAQAKDKPFYSVYIDVSHKHVIREGGYDSFPYVVPRFSKRSGETYGFGAGSQALSEIKMLNQIVEVMFRAASKNADPPILSPVDGVILPMRLDPAGINYYNPDVGPPEFWSNNFRPDYMDYIVGQKRADIEKMFFIDWMTLPNNDRMTATETMQRAQDSFKNMSAINSRMESEFLSQIVRRVYLMKVDMGDIAPPPLDDQGKEVRIEYTSPLAIAQKSISSNATLQGLSAVAQLAQFDPSVAGIINAPVAARDQLLNTYYLPSSYVRSEEELEEYNDSVQEASQTSPEAVQGYGSAAKDVADAFSTLGAV